MNYQRPREHTTVDGLPSGPTLSLNPVFGLETRTVRDRREKGVAVSVGNCQPLPGHAAHFLLRLFGEFPMPSRMYSMSFLASGRSAFRHLSGQRCVMVAGKIGDEL